MNRLLPSLLIDPANVPSEIFGGLPPVTAPAVGNEALPVGGRSAEPLELIDGDPVIAYLDAYARWGLLPPRPGRLRTGALKRLRQAASSLPDRFGLVVLDSWRSLADQRALNEFYGDRSVSEGFVAPAAKGDRPPHTTGGVVDLTLSFAGRALALGTEFDAFVDSARAEAFETDGADPHIRRLRRALAAAMTAAGFVPYWREWWHWSYGDDHWGRITNRPPIYGIATG